MKKRQSEAYIVKLEQFMSNYVGSQADELSTCLDQLNIHNQNFHQKLDDKNDRCDMDERHRGFFSLKNKPKKNSTNIQNIRLPKIELPTFDGDNKK